MSTDRDDSDLERIRDELTRLEREDAAESPVRILAVASEPLTEAGLRYVLGRERAETAEVRVAVAEGDTDPLAAIEDALVTFPADEIVLVTRDQQLVDEARERFDRPVVRLSLD